MWELSAEEIQSAVVVEEINGGSQIIAAAVDQHGVDVLWVCEWSDGFYRAVEPAASLEDARDILSIFAEEVVQLPLL